MKRYTALTDEFHGGPKESNLEVIATGLMTIVVVGIMLAFVIMFS